MPQKVTASSPAPHERILAITLGFWRSRALAVAAELELAESLAEGPLHVDVLANRAQTHSPSLFRLLRTLETSGVFSQVSPGVFANTRGVCRLARKAAGRGSAGGVCSDTPAARRYGTENSSNPELSEA
jgi:Dimerisation domain